LSEVDELPPRNDAGQFTAEEYNPPTGIDAIELGNGYQPLASPQEAAIEDVPVPTLEEFIEATGDHGYLAEHEKPEPLELKLYKDLSTGEEMPENVTVTPEQAGQILSNYEANVATYVDGLDDNALLEGIDAARAELVANDPKAAEEYGLDPQANAKPVEQPVAERPATAVRADEEIPPGVDPEIHRAVSNPKVREFLEQQLTETETAKTQYATALDAVRALAYGRLTELLPDIAAMSPAHREGAFLALQKHDPARFQAAQAEMNRIANLDGAYAQQQAQSNAVRERQQAEANAAYQKQFNTYKQEQDRLFDQQVGKVSRADIDAVNDYVENVLKLSPEEAGQLRFNPTAIDHRFQLALLHAAKWNALQSAPRPMPTPQRLPNQRPGAGERAPSVSRLEAKASLTEAEGWELLQQRMMRG
jgi:hypothetical protein